jgi:hypothetical protein
MVGTNIHIYELGMHVLAGGWNDRERERDAETVTRGGKENELGARRAGGRLVSDLASYVCTLYTVAIQLAHGTVRRYTIIYTASIRISMYVPFRQRYICLSKI